MAEAIRIGNPAIEVRVRRHSGARRMTLRIAPATRAAVLTLPPSVPLARGAAFAAEQEGWLRQRLDAAPAPRVAAEGATLPFRGGSLTLARATGARTRLVDGRLELSGPAETLPARAAAFLREAARQRCAAAAEVHAARLGRPIRRITLRDPRGRWGSCTARGDLMFSWRLILAPDPVLDYVAAHEAAHLVELNHSRRFWDLVAELDPGHAAARDWLRRHGAALHAWRFGPGD